MKKKTNGGFIAILLLSILGILFLTAIIMDFHYFSKLYDAKTPEEISKICLSDWYQNDTIKDLPVKCLNIISPTK